MARILGVRQPLLVLAVYLSLAACSGRPEAHLAKGEKSFRAGNYAEAAIHYRNAVRLDPKQAKAHYHLAKAYLELRFWENAHAELRETVSLEPGNSEAQLRLASLLIAAKEYGEGRAIASKVLAADPNNAQAHAVLGDQFALTGDAEGAVRHHQAAIKLDSKHLASYSTLTDVYTSLGRPADAEAIVTQAVESNPDSALARVYAGKFYLSRRQFARARTELEAASRLAPADPGPQLLLAHVGTTEGDLVEAEKICTRLKASMPDDPEAYRALASLYGSTGQRAKALAELQALRASKPADAWVTGYLAETLLDLGRPTEAAGLVEESLRAAPRDPTALLHKGRILIAERKYAEAGGALEGATQGAPESAGAWYHLGVAQKSLGLAESAKASLGRARKLAPGMPGPEALLAELDASSGSYDKADMLAKANPNLPMAAVIGARAELNKGNLKKAEHMVLAVLERDPAFLPALEVLTSVYAQGGRAKEGVGRLSALISQEPKKAGLHLLLARAHLDLKNLAGAEASARQALSIDSRAPEAHLLLAKIYQAKGSTAQAVNELKCGIEADPRQASTHMALAELYEKEQKWPEMRAALEEAHKLDPRSPYLKNNLAYVYLEHGGDVNAALALAQEAKSSLPGSPIVADTLGWAYHKIGSHESAITQLNLAVQKTPENASYQYHLGMAYYGAGRLEPAVAALERALRIDPNFSSAADARAMLAAIAKRPARQ